MTELAKKLRIVERTHALILSAPTRVSKALEDLPKGAKISTGGRGPFAVVVAFVARQREVEAAFRKARAALDGEGILWMAYPKKSSKVASDLSRDEGWEALAERGWVPVTQVAVDDTWSALRFRHDPALKTERQQRRLKRAAEQPTVNLRKGGEETPPPRRTRRREAATVSLRGPGLVTDGDAAELEEKKPEKKKKKKKKTSSKKKSKKG